MATLKHHNRPQLLITTPLPPGKTQYCLLNAHDGAKGQYWIVFESSLGRDSWLGNDVFSLVNTHKIPPFQRNQLIGNIEDTLDAAAIGGLVYGNNREVKPVASQENIFEIALPEPFPLGAKKYHVRIYFIEPSETLFDGIVTLLFHAKPYKENNKDVQNEYMREAAHRGNVWQAAHVARSA